MITTINRAIAKKNEENDKGFTLIELLVVILIIGVLAAIAIPAFLNQRQGAWKSQVESDLKNAALAVEQYGVKNNGKFPTAETPSSPTTGLNSASEIAKSGFTATKDVGVDYVPDASTNTYKLNGTHAADANLKLTYSSVTGTITETTP